MSEKKRVKIHTGHTTPFADTKPERVKIDPRPIRLAENQEYLKNANVKAFLDTISEAKGGDYDLRYGGIKGKKNDKWHIADFSLPPQPGYDGKTTASGRYQINLQNWTENGKKKMGLNDFSPNSQDLIAVEGLRQKNALDSVIEGNMETAISKAAQTWNALPLGKGKAKRVTDQPYRKYEDVVAIFKSHGGTVTKE